MTAPAVTGPRVMGGAPSPRELLARCVLLCLAARVVLQAVGMVSVSRSGDSPWDRFFTLWSAWDAPHYLRLAEVGYRGEGAPGDDPLFIVFFPGYPAAVSVVHVVIRDLVLAGLTVSVAAAVAASYLLHRVVSLHSDRATADRAVALLLASPTAFFLFAPFTESLFLVGALGAVYAARTGRWPAAAAAGVLASGTRVVGVVVAPALAYQALRDPAPLAAKVRRLVWCVLSTAGVAVYLGINQMVHDDPLQFLDVQREHWFQYRVWPWVPVRDAWNGLADGASGDLKFILVSRLVAVAVIASLVVLGARRLPRGDLVFVGLAFLVTMSASWLISLPRYALALYPLFVIGAQRTSSRRVFVPVVVGCVALQGWLFSRYASGRFTY